MRNSLYDALEVHSSSSVDAIQAALRAVVRRFWAVPRDASGDTEEAVRFAALATSILVDPVRRKDYDAALNPGVGAGPWRLPIASRDAANEGGTQSRAFGDEGMEVSQLSIEATILRALPGVDALAEPLPDGKTWASPISWVVLALAWLLLWYALTRPFPQWFELSSTEAGLIASGVMAVAFAMAAWMSRNQEVAGAAAVLSRLAIIKWRREGSIFIGAPPPQHDTAWIFKLRLMELTRSASGFVTSASPWRRLIARFIDYALIAIAVYLGISLIDQAVPILDEGFIFVRSVLVLPTLVVLIAIPATVLSHRVVGTTPGKWLLSLHLVTGITRPGDHAEPSDRQLLWSRATRVAWSGAALGFWPLALYRLPRHMRMARDTETDWEGRGDSLVMARPTTAPAVATGLVILLASAVILLSGWRRDYIAVWPYFVSMTVSAQAALTDALPSRSNIDTPAVPAPVTPEVPAAPVAPERPPGVAKPAPSAAPPVVAVQPPAFVSPAPAVPTQASTKPVPPPVANSAAEAEITRQASASQTRRLRIEGYARQAELSRRSGSYGGLQASCQRWTQDQPGSAHAWRCLGLAQFQNGAGREALPALRQALKFESNDAEVEAAILRILRP